MAAGEATLLQLTPDVYIEVDARAKRLEKGLLRQGVSVARVASLLTVFFRQTAPANFLEAKESNREAFGRFFHRMRDAGILLPPSQFEAWFVSAAHDDSAIDVTLAAASGAV
jgi:glutamate-1-semialdehyde 2,1-aminomutase